MVFLAHQGSSFDEVGILLGIVLIFVGIARARDGQLAGLRRWGAAAGLVVAGVAAVAFPVHQLLTGPRMADVRIASTATLAIASPAAGSLITDPMLEFGVRLERATLSRDTTTDLRPDAGHLHVTIDGVLKDRWIDLVDRIDVSDLDPGEHLLEVEFAATDHGPFAPPIRALAPFRIGEL